MEGVCSARFGQRTNTSIQRGRLTTHDSEVKRPGMIQNTSWVPLQNTQGQRCILWAYDKDDPRLVVYRFVWTKPNMPDVVFYVGSGLNLNGPKLSGIKLPRASTGVTGLSRLPR